jgi:hypothetical protein
LETARASPPTRDLDARPDHGGSGGRSPDRDAAPEGALEGEAVDAAAARAVEVVRPHRGLLSRLNRIATRLTLDLELHLTELPVIPWMRPTDTVAGVVLRVAQALGKAVPLERQAFSVGVGEDKPQGPTVALPNWKDLFARAGIRDGLARALAETPYRRQVRAGPACLAASG